MAVAVSAIGAAVAAFGTEAFAGLAFTALADTGVALSVVGAVTGSKDLMKAGAVMGLAGGIGSMATASFGSAMDAAAASDVGSLGSGAASGASDAMDAAAASDVGNLGSGAGDMAQSSSVAAGNATAVNLPPLADQTGDAIGGNAAITGAGGNVDPLTGQVANSGQIPSTPVGATPTNPVGTTAVSTAPSDAALTPTGTPPSGLITSPSNGQVLSANGAAGGIDSAGGVLDKAVVGGGTQANSIIGSIKDLWSGLNPTAKAEVLKAALAVPGGIQAQQNKAREVALQQQRINQTSYGSQVPTFSIANARG